MNKTTMAIAIMMLVALLASHIAFASPTYTITNDNGGVTTSYEAKYARWGREKAKVIIDGKCASACTLVVSTRYKLDVCATEKAELLFHKPYFSDPDTGKLLDTPYFRAKSEVDWFEQFVAVMPSSIANVLFMAPIPSVYHGDKATDMQGWREPRIYRHVKKCE